MKRFRDCEQYQEIRNWFHQAIELKHQFICWQQVKHSDRYVVTILPDFMDREIEFKVIDKRSINKYKMSEPIYLYSEYKDILLKTNIISTTNNRLKIEFPKTIKIEELRSEKRFDFKDIKYADVEIAKIGSTESLPPSNYHLYDISENGISFITGSNNTGFAKGDLVAIENILNESFFENLTGEIHHVTELGTGSGIVNNTYKKIGIKTKRKLPLKRYILFQKHIQHSI